MGKLRLKRARHGFNPHPHLAWSIAVPCWRRSGVMVQVGSTPTHPRRVIGWDSTQPVIESHRSGFSPIGDFFLDNREICCMLVV